MRQSIGTLSGIGNLVAYSVHPFWVGSFLYSIYMLSGEFPEYFGWVSNLFSSSVDRDVTAFAILSLFGIGAITMWKLDKNFSGPYYYFHNWPVHSAYLVAFGLSVNDPTTPFGIISIILIAVIGLLIGNIAASFWVIILSSLCYGIYRDDYRISHHEIRPTLTLFLAPAILLLLVYYLLSLELAQSVFFAIFLVFSLEGASWLLWASVRGMHGDPKHLSCLKYLETVFRSLRASMYDRSLRWGDLKASSGFKNFFKSLDSEINICFKSQSEMKVEFHDESELTEKGEHCGYIESVDGNMLTFDILDEDGEKIGLYESDVDRIELYQEDLVEAKKRGIKEFHSWVISRGISRAHMEKIASELEKRSFTKSDDPEFYKNWNKKIMESVGESSEDAYLSLAIKGSPAEFVKHFIDEDKNRMFLDLGNGWTPLMLAAAERRFDVVRLFLKEGADPNVQNDLGNNALHYASRYGESEIVQLLTEFGADVNMHGESGHIPLHSCISMATDFDTASVLVRSGSDWDAKDENGETCREYARKFGVADWIRKLNERL